MGWNSGAIVENIEVNIERTWGTLWEKNCIVEGERVYNNILQIWLFLV
jgi:hypothetical protein